MNEHDKAKRWRERLNLSQEDLSELTGYSRVAIGWFERGKTPPSRKVSAAGGDIRPWVWLRYKRACQGAQAELKGEKFKW